MTIAFFRTKVQVLSNANMFPAGNAYLWRAMYWGMYFFGDGNFVSAYGTTGLSLNKYCNLQGGYQLSSRLVVKSTDSRIGLNLTQRGALAGLEASF